MEHMILKIYDQDGNYEVDTINLDNYDLEQSQEEIMHLIIDIIESYQDNLED